MKFDRLSRSLLRSEGSKAFRLPNLQMEAFGDVRLSEVHTFGSNPGNLNMFTFLPPMPESGHALVVVLHGCTQTAASYDFGAGWSTLAERFGFALLLPEQQQSNNPSRCFNWFQHADTKRGYGEALSIRQMVDHMVDHHRIDRSRIFVTGLSAGGAMTSVMLATYPDVFAGGGIIAGLPYGAASNVQEAFQSMAQASPRSAREWGDLVRNASPHSGPWPKVSVWHGGADMTVKPSNADEIIRQWVNVHGLDIGTSRTDRVDDYPRRVWRDAAGNEVIESFTITGMPHGTPLSVGEDDTQCGSAGAFMLETGISSSYHLAKYWGLTSQRFQTAAKSKKHPALQRADSSKAPVSRGSSQIESIIKRALSAAGLMRTD